MLIRIFSYIYNLKCTIIYRYSTRCIYSYTINSLRKFVNLPKSKNEINLNLEQYRAMDEGMNIGVNYVPEIPPSIDTKDDLITVENIIREDNAKN